MKFARNYLASMHGVRSGHGEIRSGNGLAHKKRPESQHLMNKAHEKAATVLRLNYLIWNGII
uniref:Uncharacterized protein n=1 Tax=Romanomermis culicivorax TaxID=13658 RepID=A0A915IDI4_ROMCU